MAKPSYKIPSSLDISYADIEISIRNKDGVRLKPIAMKTIGLYLLLRFVYGFLITKTFIVDGSFMSKFFFTIFYFRIGIFWIKTDSSKRNGIQLVPSLMHYLPKKSRHINTRVGNKAYDYLHILGLQDPPWDDRGVINYMDGTVGHGFRVVGSASILLFDEDQTYILNRVSKFYNKLDTDIEIIFDTTKESQKVDKQVKNVERQFAERELKDVPGLNKLFVEKRDTLKDYVGSRFQSIHQYMFVKAKNLEALEKFIQMLQQETSDSTAVFKKVQLMRPQDLEEYFKHVKRVE